MSITHRKKKEEKEFEYYIDKIKIWGLRSCLVSIVSITHYSFLVGPRLNMCVWPYFHFQFSSLKTLTKWVMSEMKQNLCVSEWWKQSNGGNVQGLTKMCKNSICLYTSTSLQKNPCLKTIYMCIYIYFLLRIIFLSILLKFVYYSFVVYRIVNIRWPSFVAHLFARISMYFFLRICIPVYPPNTSPLQFTFYISS